MDKIEALKAAMHEANRVAREAYEAARIAETECKGAVLDATGLKGCLVEYTGTRGWGSRATTVTKQFVVTGLGRWSTECVSGPNVKKDGTLGEMRLEYRIAGLTNLGPYKAPGDA